MTRAELRLELLKISYTHGRDVVEAVSRAKSMEEYVFQESSEINKEPSDGPKSTLKVKKDYGNIGPLR